MPAGRKHPQHKSESQRSSAKPAKRLRISIIGAGRMGTALGLALRRAGYRIEAVVTKNLPSARRAAKLIGRGATALAERQLDNAPTETVRRISESDLLLISTPDDVLDAVAERLAATIRRARTDRRKTQRIALHTSGAVSSDVLAQMRAIGFSVGSLHPLVSVADATTAQNHFRGAHFCVEGDLAGARIARSLVTDLGGHSFTISSEAKPLYHAAAAISSGHVVALFDLAIEMLAECGLTKRHAQQILAPLLTSTAANLSAKSPTEALTGPFARGDVATIGKHLAAMKANKKLNEAADSYVALGLRAATLAKAAKGNRKSFEAIEKLLSRRRPPVL